MSSNQFQRSRRGRAVESPQQHIVSFPAYGPQSRAVVSPSYQSDITYVHTGQHIDLFDLTEAYFSVDDSPNDIPTYAPLVSSIPQSILAAGRQKMRLLEHGHRARISKWIVRPWRAILHLKGSFGSSSLLSAKPRTVHNHYERTLSRSRVGQKIKRKKKRTVTVRKGRLDSEVTGKAKKMRQIGACGRAGPRKCRARSETSARDVRILSRPLLIL
ncbi:hypothetical protein WAI453_002040 [Rhynchosporium graminicola]